MALPDLQKLSQQGFLTLQDAAQWASVSKKTLNRWIKIGLPYFQSGPRTKILLRPQDIEQFLTRKVNPKESLEEIIEQTLRDLKPDRQGKGKPIGTC